MNSLILFINNPIKRASETRRGLEKYLNYQVEYQGFNGGEEFEKLLSESTVYKNKPFVLLVCARDCSEEKMVSMLERSVKVPFIFQSISGDDFLEDDKVVRVLDWFKNKAWTEAPTAFWETF